MFGNVHLFVRYHFDCCYDRIGVVRSRYAVPIAGDRDTWQTSGFACPIILCPVLYPKGGRCRDR
jgi:hypothetical protein